MQQIDSEQISSAINSFLREKREQKLEPETKKLTVAHEKGDNEAVSLIVTNIEILYAKYEKDTWCSDAGDRMAKQLKFGSHMSKGVHPDSKGDNIAANITRELATGIVGSQSLSEMALDANGNAAALPLASFLSILVDEDTNTKLSDLIIKDHLALANVFHTDKTRSEQLQLSFKNALIGERDQPTSDARNKQLLWPNSKDAISKDQYVMLVPLHPSALVGAVYRKLNTLRFSEENKEARANKDKKNVIPTAYVSIPNLAVKQLGGTKPQNVSLLNSQQGGRNLLLPSLPPKFSSSRRFAVSKMQKSVFNNNLAYQARADLEQLYAVIKDEKNNVDLRDSRADALDKILARLIEMAIYIQTTYPAGWSEECQLSMAQKYWLDPQRAEIEDQDHFKNERAKFDWLEEITADFGLWINALLRKKFKAIKYQFSDSEDRELRSEMMAAIKASQRSGDGGFL